MIEAATSLSHVYRKEQEEGRRNKTMIAVEQICLIDVGPIKFFMFLMVIRSV